MAAATYDFVIEQGTTLNKSFIWKSSDGVVIPLTGFTARMQVRATQASPDVLLALSTADATIVITPNAGKVTLSLSSTATAAIAWRRGKYDLELVSPTGVVTRLLSGTIEVSREITR